MSESGAQDAAGCLFIVGVILVSMAIGGLAGYLYGLLFLGAVFVVWAVMTVSGRTRL